MMSDCSERMVRLGKDVVVPDGYEVDEVRCVKFGESYVTTAGGGVGKWCCSSASASLQAVLRKLPLEFEAGEVVRLHGVMNVCYVVTKGGGLKFLDGRVFLDHVERGKYVIASDATVEATLAYWGAAGIVRRLIRQLYGK